MNKIEKDKVPFRTHSHWYLTANTSELMVISALTTRSENNDARRCFQAQDQPSNSTVFISLIDDDLLTYQYNDPISDITVGLGLDTSG